MRTGVLIACAVLLIFAGCKSKKQKHEEMMLQTPLALDPTEHHDFDGWWSNGRQLLRLDADAGYELFGTTNQYGQPIQRGRWSQQNYATLWLEPYTELSSNRVRVTVTKDDGVINISLPGAGDGGAPMTKIAAPPPVLEDRLIGRWTGPAGDLNLTSAMTYTLAPIETAAEGKVAGVIVGHRGTWALANDDLILQPETGAVQAMRWKVSTNDKAVQIEAPGGALTRVQSNSG